VQLCCACAGSNSRPTAAAAPTKRVFPITTLQEKKPPINYHLPATAATIVPREETAVSSVGGEFSSVTSGFVGHAALRYMLCRCSRHS